MAKSRRLAPDGGESATILVPSSEIDEARNFCIVCVFMCLASIPVFMYAVGGGASSSYYPVDCSNNTLRTFDGEEVCRSSASLCSYPPPGPLGDVKGEPARIDPLSDDFCFDAGNGKHVCHHKFIEGIRNPCFSVDNELYCLPYFFLAGVAKCGTGTLHAGLTQHPHIMKTTKEPFWWGYKDPDLMLKYAGKQFGGLVDCLSSADGERYKDVVVADMTPAYFWRLVDIPKVISAARPDARIVVIFRDPITRTWSDFKWQNTVQSKRISPDDYDKMPGMYHDRVVEVVDNLERCFNPSNKAERDLDKEYSYDERFEELDERFKRGGCAYNKGLDHKEPKPTLRVSGSLYAHYLYNWLQYFPAENILIVTNEALGENRELVFNSIFEFLGLPDHDIVKDVDQYPQQQIPPPREETQEILRKFFEPHNQLLRDLVDEHHIRVVGNFEWQKPAPE